MQVPVSNFGQETTRDLKIKCQKEWEFPFPTQRLIFRGRQMEDDRFLSDYGIRNGSVVYCVLKAGRMAIAIDNDDYIDNEYWIAKETIGELKRKIYVDLKDREFADEREFWSKYGVHHANEELMDSDLLTDNYAKYYGLKTKNGQIYYLENKRIIHDQNCLLLTFGFIKEMKIDSTLNVPVEIHEIIKQYLNKNDIDFQN